MHSPFHGEVQEGGACVKMAYVTTARTKIAQAEFKFKAKINLWCSLLSILTDHLTSIFKQQVQIYYWVVALQYLWP